MDRERLIVRPLGRPGDLGWVVQANAEVYDDEYGFDTSYETLVARIVTDFAEGFDAARERGWIAELDGERVGCVFCVASDPTLAKLRLLLVHPKARGHGAGDRLVRTCLDFAREVGYHRMTLWTNSVLGSARRIYEGHGFVLTDSAPHHSFGQDLVGQNWARDL